MNYNLKRHSLLNLLSKQHLKKELDLDNYNEGHVFLEEILKKLNLKEIDLLVFIKEMTKSEEIDYYYYYYWNDEDKKGLFIKPNGLTSLSNKKYILVERSKWFNLIKDVVQIIIPVITLVITLFVIKDSLSKESKYNTQVQQLKERIEKLENKESIVKKSAPQSVPVNK